jgi:subtilase family serine protease
VKISNFSALALSCGAFVLVTACGSSQSPIGEPNAMTQGVATSSHAVPQWQARHQAHAACPQVVGKPTCLVLISEKNGLSPASGCNPSSSCGWTATQLETAYGITGSLKNGSKQKVAVIEAGDDPDAATTFSTYRSEYKLGTSGTLVKYNQSGQESNYPPSCENYGWCVETDLDIEMVAAACPKCTVYLMEAGSSISDFEAAEAEAVTLGATILSNSWGCYGSDDCGDSNFNSYFDKKGIAYLAATGDEGYGQIGAPAVLDSVIAVGGTQLQESGSKYSESLWADAGGGCATGVTKPKWQHDPDCSYRTVGDVSSEAGCAPAVAEYSALYGEWFGVCGTSVASPFTAGVIGLAGNATGEDGGKNFWVLTQKQHKSYFHHPTGGNSCCNYIGGDGRYKKYYSGPGGWGSPNGIRAY